MLLLACAGLAGYRALGFRADLVHDLEPSRLFLWRYFAALALLFPVALALSNRFQRIVSGPIQRMAGAARKTFVSNDRFTPTA